MDPITQLVSLGTAGAGGESYWILSKYTTSSSTVDYGIDVDVDSAGNIVAFSEYNFIFDNFHIMKIDKDGGVLTERYLRGSGGVTPKAMVLDDSDNIYVTGYGSAWGETHYIAKINSSYSATTWSKKYLQTSGQGDCSNSTLIHDSSGNIYAGGGSMPGSFTGTTVASLYKVNSSGTLQWFKHLDSSNYGYDRIQELKIDSSNNIYSVGRSGYGSNSTSILLTKWNTSGTVQWQRFIGGSLADESPSLGLDSSGNVYINWAQRIGSGKDICTAKFNSSGTLQWQRALNGSAYLGTGNQAGQVAVDSSGNVFSAFKGGRSTIGGNVVEDHIAKYNSSGVLQWQMGIGSNFGGSSSAYVRFTKLFIDDNDNLIISAYGEDYASARILVLKLPTDNPVASGTYGNFVFYTTTATDSAGTNTVTNGSISPSTPTNYSEQTLSVTLGSTSLNSALTDIE